MKTIRVNVPSAVYDIHIENGLMAKIGHLIGAVTTSRKAVVVTDRTVDGLYGTQLVNNLTTAGFKVDTVVIEPGEASKSLAVLGQLYQAFTAAPLNRSDLVIALGGGVVGDITGFAAATYLRGIAYIQIPTTLLAQIDSSVGGKTAINLPAGKNLAGAFWQPAAVLIDPELLHSLPARTLADGLAEAIKYGAIADQSLFEQLAACPSQQEFLAQAADIIAQCCTIKRNVVSSDERDTGHRMVLNFGHTIGHAIEQLSNYQVYTHGEAVAIGMVKVSEYSESMGLSRPQTAERIKQALLIHGLPVSADLSDQASLVKTLALDKKNAAAGLQLVIVPELGSADIITLPADKLATLL